MCLKTHEDILYMAILYIMQSSIHELLWVLKTAIGLKVVANKYIKYIQFISVFITA